RAHVPCRGVARLQLGAAAQIRERLVEPPEPVQEMSASVGSIAMARIELERLREGGQRLHCAPRRDQGIALLPPELRVIGLALYRRVERLQRVVVPVEVRQRKTERCEISGLRSFRDRTRGPFHRMLELPRL